MKILILILLILLSIQAKTQRNDFVEIRPDLKVMQQDLNIFRELTGKKDTVIDKSTVNSIVINYVQIGKSELIDFIYDDISYYHWKRKNRKGLVDFQSMEIKFYLNLSNEIKKIKVKFAKGDKSVIISRVLGSINVRNLPEWGRPEKDKEMFQNMFLNFAKEVPR